MLKSAASKVMWVGRATVFLVGLAVILALVFGITSTAFAHRGDKGFFHLGHKNVKHAVSKLVGRVAGPSLVIGNGSADRRATALRLNVKPGKPPMQVNSDRKVARLNADKLDGKDASQIGVNSVEIVEASSAYDTESVKYALAVCPPGKTVIGGSARYSSSETGLNRRPGDEIAIQGSGPYFSYSDRWVAEADWMGGSGSSPFNWRLIAYAICAKAP